MANVCSYNENLSLLATWWNVFIKSGNLKIKVACPEVLLYWNHQLGGIHSMHKLLEKQKIVLCHPCKKISCTCIPSAYPARISDTIHYRKDKFTTT